MDDEGRLPRFTRDDEGNRRPVRRKALSDYRHQNQYSAVIAALASGNIHTPVAGGMRPWDFTPRVAVEYIPAFRAADFPASTEPYFDEGDGLNQRYRYAGPSPQEQYLNRYYVVPRYAPDFLDVWGPTIAVAIVGGVAAAGAGGGAAAAAESGVAGAAAEGALVAEAAGGVELLSGADVLGGVGSADAAALGLSGEVAAGGLVPAAGTAATTVATLKSALAPVLSLGQAARALLGGGSGGPAAPGADGALYTGAAPADSFLLDLAWTVGALVLVAAGLRLVMVRG